MKTLFKHFIKNKNLSFIPAMLLLVSSFISIILYNGNGAITPCFYVSLLLSILFLVFNFYIALYSYLDIQKSFSSLIFFLINNLILLSYIYGFFILVRGLPKPIYISDLNTFSQYRYLFLSIFTLMIFIVYLLTLLSPKFKTFIYSFNLNFLKNNIVPLIQESTSIGLSIDKYCVKLLDLLIISKKSNIIFFSLQFFIFYIYRIYILYLFLLFSFFHGDLRQILYFIPLSLFCWLFSFFVFYFNWFINDNISALEEYIHISILKNAEKKISVAKIYTIDYSSINVELTSYGYKQNLTIKDIPRLKNWWLKLININVFFIKFNYYFKFINYIIISLYFICWFKLCLTYFYNNDLYFLVNIFGFGFFVKRGFHATPPAYARKGYYLHESEMNPLKEKTKGLYSPGHKVWADKNPITGKLEAQGQFTHDTQNRTSAKKIDSQTDVMGNNKPQKGIGFENPVEIDEKRATEIPKSEEYCAKNKDSLDTMSPKPKNFSSDSTSGSDIS